MQPSEQQVNELKLKKKTKNQVPFGYKISEQFDSWMEPVYLEIEALRLAKEYLETSSQQAVATWVSTVTGRRISVQGLVKRIYNGIYLK